MSKIKRAITIPAILAISLGGSFALATAANGAASASRGVAKVDKDPFDIDPNNEPHTGCTFQVDLAGYSAGDPDVEVTFTVQPPSGSEIVLLRDVVHVGGDAAGGANDIDAQKEYELSPYLYGFDAHPQQGYHVKLNVYSPGDAAGKQKTFWVQSCSVPGGGGDS